MQEPGFTSILVMCFQWKTDIWVTILQKIFIMVETVSRFLIERQKSEKSRPVALKIGDSVSGRCCCTARREMDKWSL